MQCLHHCAAIVILVPTAPLQPTRVCCSGPDSRFRYLKLPVLGALYPAAWPPPDQETWARKVVLGYLPTSALQLSASVTRAQLSRSTNNSLIFTSLLLPAPHPLPVRPTEIKEGIPFSFQASPATVIRLTANPEQHLVPQPPRWPPPRGSQSTSSRSSATTFSVAFPHRRSPYASALPRFPMPVAVCLLSMTFLLAPRFFAPIRSSWSPSLPTQGLVTSAL